MCTRDLSSLSVRCYTTPAVSLKDYSSASSNYYRYENITDIFCRGAWIFTYDSINKLEYKYENQLKLGLVVLFKKNRQSEDTFGIGGASLISSLHNSQRPIP